MPNPSQRPGLVLTVLSLAAFMASLDVFIVNVAFDDIGSDFHGTTLSQLSWVLNAYAIVYAALLVPAGRIADRYGRKGGFILGLAIFTVASAACAASDGIWVLVGFRVLQAVGAALLTPASLGLVVASARPENRARAVRIWAATGALAAALGPAVGGMLVEASWRWVFLVNVPIGIVALLAAAAWVPRSRDETVTRMPDVLGALLLAVAIGALALGLVEGPTWGWGAGRTDAAWAVTILGLAGFVLSSRRHAVPVIEPALLRVRAFAWSNATALLFAVPFAAALLTNILWMQQVWHYSPLKTGFAIAPGPLMVPIFAAVAHRLASRIPIGRIVALGCLLVGAGGVLTSLSVGSSPNYASSVLPGWLVGGIGVGLALPSILSSATADLPAARAATGSAVVNMNRQIGTALGVSLVVAVLGTPVGYSAAHTAFQHTWWAFAAVAVLAALAAPGMTPVGASATEPAASAAFRRHAASHLPVGDGLIERDGLLGFAGTEASPDARLLVTDDTADSVLHAMLPAISAGTIKVLNTASGCCALLDRTHSWARESVTAMVCLDLSAVPDLPIQAGLAFHPVRRMPADAIDGVSLAHAAAANLQAQPDATTAPPLDRFISYLRALPDRVHLFAAIDESGVVQATSASEATGDDARAFFVSTLPSWRGRGIGTAMAAAALRDAARFGSRQASLESTHSGIGIYTRLAFEPVSGVTVYHRRN